MNRKLVISIVVVIILAGIGSYYLFMSEAAKKANINQANQTSSAKYAGKKILVIDSYNVGSDSSDLKEKGIDGVLNNTGIEIKRVYLDEKRNPDEKFQKEAALNVKSTIESFKPDVIISLDDPALKYVIMPYYKDSNIPVVFGGVNWDASIYGIPYSNTTGMTEVSLINNLIVYLKGYSQGNRLGLLAGNTETDRKNVEFYKKSFKISITREYHLDTFEEWKQAFLRLQNEVDFVIIENNAGIKNWNNAEAEAFVLKNTKIPTGTVLEFLAPYTLMGLVKVTEEQGEWPAQAALKILDGANPRSIPEVTNKRSYLKLNLKIAKKLNIAFTPALIRAAKTIIKEE